MGDDNCVVRAFKVDDLREWFRLRSLLWDQTSEEEHRGEMLGILDHPDTQFVAVADAGNGKLAGFLEASIRPFVEDCSSETVGYLEGWFVDPDFRRHGIGGRLVDLAEEWASSRGCREMASDAEINNDKSIGAHLGLGYEETSRLVHFRKELV